MPEDLSLISIQEAVISSVLIGYPDCCHAVGQLHPDDFLTAELKAITQAILKLHKSASPVDIASVRLLVADSVPSAYVTSLLSISPSGRHFRGYFERMQKANARMKAEIAAKTLLAGLAQSNGNLPELIADARKTLDSAGRAAASAPAWTWAGDAAKQALLEMEEAASGAPLVIPTGIGLVDDKLGGGFHLGEHAIVAGPTSRGKTSFMLNVVNASFQRWPVLYFSYESAPSQLLRCFATVRRGLSLTNMRSGNLSDDERESFRLVHEEIQSRPFAILPKIEDGVSFICGQVYRFVAEYGPGLVVIDTINRVYENNRKLESRQKELAYISNRLEDLCLETKTALVALSQFSRAATKSEERPDASALRDCGELEEHASVVIIIWRPKLKPGEVVSIPLEHHLTEICIAKQRHGPTGHAIVIFNPFTLSFTEFKE